MAKKDKKAAEIDAEVKEAEATAAEDAETEPVAPAEVAPEEVIAEAEAAKADAEAKARLAELEAKCRELEENCEALRERLMRNQAESENYKKRMMRERDEAISFANGAIVEDLLPVLDSFQPAIEAAKSNEAVCKGIEMVRDVLLSVLKKWGLEEIEAAVGSEFNPEVHEACLMVTDPEVETETVKAVLQPGYRLHGRVIRHTKVQVAKPE